MRLLQAVEAVATVVLATLYGEMKTTNVSAKIVQVLRDFWLEILHQYHLHLCVLLTLNFSIFPDDFSP